MPKPNIDRLIDRLEELRTECKGEAFHVRGSCGAEAYVITLVCAAPDMIEELRRLREVEAAARNLERSIATGGVCYVNETLEYDALRAALEKGKD